MNYSTRIDDLEVWITLNDIKEAVEDFDDDSREELIEHLKECLVNYPKEMPCDEYQKFVDDVDVEVEVGEDELMDQKGDEIMAIAQKDKILVEAPNMAIEIEIEEALRAIFNKHGLNPEAHMWGF